MSDFYTNPSPTSITGRMFDGLLFNTYHLSDWTKYIQVAHMQTQCCQAGTGGKMTLGGYATLDHGDGPPIFGFRFLMIGMHHHRSFFKPFAPESMVANLYKN